MNLSFLTGLISPLQRYLQNYQSPGDASQQYGSGSDYYTPNFVRNSVNDVEQHITNSALGQGMRHDYQMPTTAEDAYTNFLGQMPQRPDHYSTMRKIGAVIAGMGSKDPMGTADQFLNYPYYNQMKDWQVKAPWLEKNADNERQSNDLIRRTMHDEEQSDVANRRADISQQRADDYNKRIEDENRHNMESEAIARRRAEIAAQVANGGQLHVNDKTGKVQMIYKDGTTLDIPDNVLSFEEKENIKQRNALAQIQAKGAQERTTKEAPTYPQSHPEASTTGGMSESQKRIRAERLATQAVSVYPAWKDYIQFDEHGKFLRTGIPEGKPGGFMSQSTPGGNKETLDKVNMYIYGTSGPPSEERVGVIGPDGKEYTLPKGQLQDFLKDNPTYKAKGGV